MTALALFVKTPTLSPVKTRLAAEVGEARALAIYLALVEQAKVTAAASGLDVCWAVGEENGRGDPLWRDFPALWTGPGHIGTRMRHVYEILRARHCSALLMGVDIPQVTAEMLIEAGEQARHGFVLGPARDGGFWLFGGCEPVPGTAWEAPDWGAPDTCDRFVNALPGPILRHAPLLIDIDHQRDMVDSGWHGPSL